jgi:hypothetical protein
MHSATHQILICLLHLFRSPMLDSDCDPLHGSESSCPDLLWSDSPRAMKGCSVFAPFGLKQRPVVIL